VLTLVGALLMAGVIVTTLFTKEFHTTCFGLPFLIGGAGLCLLRRKKG
jgi:hypothetical protein